jgi:ABC-type phosphate transport system substrate-binding protein
MRTWLIVVLALALSHPSAADEPSFVVIVNRGNDNTKLDKKSLADAFLKKQTRWNEDKPIQPVDLNKGSAVRRRFSEDVLGRSVSSVRTYWNQLVFSGRGVPPPELDSDVDVVKYVASHPGAIGYVSASTDVKTVNVVQLR